MKATNHSNYAFRFGLRRLATKPTAKSGLKGMNITIPFYSSCIQLNYSAQYSAICISVFL